AGSAADAQEQRHRRTPAAKLGADLRLTRWDYRTLTLELPSMQTRIPDGGPHYRYSAMNLIFSGFRYIDTTIMPALQGLLI
ncbi:hypothetical protein, partial [Alloalcanivorax dieselolei]|uniref:hypothetical protein n=1 Tax=Alloalcanivorax dieselolei TaxID=285091 RepID=UPI001E541610